MRTFVIGSFAIVYLVFVCQSPTGVFGQMPGIPVMPEMSGMPRMPGMDPANWINQGKAVSGINQISNVPSFMNMILKPGVGG